MKIRIVVFLISLATILGCSTEPQPASSELAAGAPASATTGEPAQTGSSELADTSWRLVKIMSMDDSVYEPEDRLLYTLEFKSDGSVAVRGDCNRGSGSWTTESPGQVQFGLMASTMAECPDPLSERYLRQFEWVRSYVMRDGHLFLATMADGAIIEFEPAPQN